MAGIFLNLKIALLRNRAAALRRNPSGGQTLAVSVVVLGLLAHKYGGAFYDNVSRTGSFPNPGPLLAQLSFSIVFLWIVLPLTYGGRRDLDVRRLQLLPIRPAKIALGLASTLIFSPGLWLTAAVAAVLAAGFPDAAAHLPLLTLSCIALVLMCAITGQVVVTGADLLARQRHARDLLLLLTVVLAAVPVVLFVVLRQQYAGSGPTTGSAGILQWVPPAWPGVAMAAAGQGMTVSALTALGGSFAVTALGVWAWTAIIKRSMLAQDSSTIRPHRSGDPFAGFAHRLPGDRRGAVAALELRLLWREPARLPGAILSTLIFGGMYTVVAAALFSITDPALAAFGVCVTTFCAVGRRANEIGTHASELWTNVVARGRASDDLIGRDLASAVIDVPLLLTALIAIAVDRSGWTYALPALLFGLSALLATYAVLRIVNIKFAKAQPRSKDTQATPQRQDLGLNLVVMLSWILAVVPVLAAAALVVLNPTWLALALPLAVAYGVGSWWGSLRWMGRWLDQHQAELLVRIQAG